MSMTPEEEEKYVKDRWDAVIQILGGKQRVRCIYGGCEQWSTDDIHAAYLFTLEREKEITDLQADIQWLNWPSIKAAGWAGNEREHILGIVQAALAKLLTGWK